MDSHRLIGARQRGWAILPPVVALVRASFAAAQHEGHVEVVSVLEKAIEERRTRDGPGLPGPAWA